MLFLIRHAHSAYSPDDTRGLSSSGGIGAQRVADILEGSEISAIYSSPYARAVQTVQPLAHRLGISLQIEPDLRERCLSPDPLDDFQRMHEATWCDFELAYPGGESSAAAQIRMRHTICRIAEAATGRNVAIASHGNALALFLRTLDPSVDHAFWARMSMPDVYAVDTSVGTNWSYRRVWKLR